MVYLCFQENFIFTQESPKPESGRKPKTITPIICSEEGCLNSFETVSAFKTHLESHAGGFVCSEETCIKRFVDKDALLAHEKKHKGEKPFACSECKKEYATKHCSECKKEYACV